MPRAPLHRVRHNGLPRELTDALSRLAHNNIETVAWQGDQWVVVYDRNRFESCHTLSRTLKHSLQSLAARDAHIRQVQFTPWPGGWAILHDRNGLLMEHEPTGLREGIAEVVREGSLVHSVAFNNVGGWVLSVDGRPGRAAGAISAAVSEAVHRAAQLDFVGFTPTGGYLLLERGRAAELQGLPDGAALALAELAREQKRVKLASFDAAGAWLVLAQ